jgi:predicted nucleic acid-binding Zn ribbon protein
MPNEEKVTIVTEPTYTRKCKECHQQFTTSENEVKWLKEHNLAPFKRCRACRQRRKVEAAKKVLGESDKT